MSEPKLSAREYLSGAWKIKLRIESMTRVLEFLQSAAEYTGPAYSDMPKSAARNIHKNEDAVIRVMEHKERIEAERRKLADVMDTIAGISDPAAQAVVVKHYIDRKTWARTAAEVFVSERQARRLHAAALAEVEQILNPDRECP